jgi:tRNA A-37 threonylcarbamoyl transferase component Bud32/tetratricopeptide (TPR) repeat protein
VAVTTGVLPERYAEPRLIGHGGMGEIYLAEDRELGRKVAVKVLAERFARDEGLRSRFTREALAAARLSTEQHVVTIYDVGESAGRPFIVMEYLGGGTLGVRARDSIVHPDQALHWLDQVGQALDAAHAQGIVHRDVKPANLLFDDRGQIRVVDFGVARVVDETTGQLTAAGTVLGTAGYISPEQASGQAASAASDLYSLGIVAYELLTGGRPFERGSATAEALAHLHEPVPPASERSVGLPRSVDAVFQRALAKDPGRRYGSAAAFVSALRAALEPDEEPTRAYGASPTVMGTQLPPARRRRPSAFVPLAGALAAALVLGGLLAAFAATRGGERAGEENRAPQPPPSPQEVTVTLERTLPGTTVIRTVTDRVPSAPPAPVAGGLSAGEAAVLNDEAYGLMREGRYEEALPLLRRAVPALRGTFTTGFRYEAYAEYNLGKTLAELGRCSAALPHLERSEDLQGAREPITAAKEQCGA